MVGLVDMFKVMGWRSVLEFQHDYNEAVIHQFYATMEVWAKKEELTWMTGNHRFKATFKDFVVAMRLNYRKMK